MSTSFTINEMTADLYYTSLRIPVFPASIIVSRADNTDSSVSITDKTRRGWDHLIYSDNDYCAS